MAQPPVVSPPIPYVGSVRLVINQRINIQGKAPLHASGFSINLCSSPNLELLDTMLHFNPRFNENCVVRNSKQYGNWAHEERSGGLPFQKGVPFEIIIEVHQSQYNIMVNGKNFTQFRHRLPIDNVAYLIINGDVEVNFIKFEGPSYGFHTSPAGFHMSPASFHTSPAGFHISHGASIPPPAGSNLSMGSAGAFPQPGGAYYPPAQGYPGAGGASQPMYNPAVPLTTGIPGVLCNGRMIFISGIPHNNPSRFTINLLSGTDKALHFDVRFNFGDSRNVVVRTHCQYGTYGPEERQASYFPFMPNANFDMIILVEQSSYKVAVNNQHFVEFKHRLPSTSVTALNVEGDVKLSQVRFQ